MITKIVYTVVGGKNEMFLPQALVAGYSARRYNPNAIIILIVDIDTASVIDDDIPSFYKYFNSIVKIEVPQELSQMQKSRYLKTTLRQNITGDYLYIDTDTVVTCDLSEIDTCTHDIAAVLDRHSLVSEHEFKNKISKDISFMNIKLSDLKDKYFNGGVMYVKDNYLTHEFFRQWHKFWDEARQKERNIDQPPLAKANKECGYPITEIDGTWNCQLSDNFINFLADSKILHYFASNNRSPYSLYDTNLYDEVMKYGDIPQYLKDKLENPKQLFLNKHILAYGYDVYFLRTNLHAIYVYHKYVFKFFELCAKLLVKKHL